MKKATLLCAFIITTASTQITCSSYAKRIEQTAFNNHHRHEKHNAANYFATIKFEKASADARAAQERMSPSNQSPITTTRSFSPEKPKTRKTSL